MGIRLEDLDEVLERQEAGVEVKLTSWDGLTPLGVSIWVAGPDSALAQKARESLQQDLIDNLKLTLTPAEQEERSIRYLAKITMRWDPNFERGDEQLECNEKNALEIYRRYRFIRQQVDLNSGRAAFLKASSSSSPTP